MQKQVFLIAIPLGHGTADGSHDCWHDFVTANLQLPGRAPPGDYTRFGVTSVWAVIQEIGQFFGLKPHQPLRKELL